MHIGVLSPTSFMTREILRFWHSIRFTLIELHTISKVSDQYNII